jgi:hypothetical protein
MVILLSNVGGRQCCARSVGRLCAEEADVWTRRICRRRPIRHQAPSLTRCIDSLPRERSRTSWAHPYVRQRFVCGKTRGWLCIHFWSNVRQSRSVVRLSAGSWNCRLLPELDKEYPALYVTWNVSSLFTTAHHLTLSCIIWIESTPAITLISVLILFSHLRLDLKTELLPSVFPTKALYVIIHACYIPRQSPSFDHPNNVC